MSKSITTPKSRRGLKGLYSEVIREVKKVDWPSRPETTRLTGIVLTVVFSLIGVLYILSTAVEKILDVLLHKGLH